MQNLKARLRVLSNDENTSQSTPNLQTQLSQSKKFLRMLQSQTNQTNQSQEIQNRIQKQSNLFNQTVQLVPTNGKIKLLSKGNIDYNDPYLTPQNQDLNANKDRVQVLNFDFKTVSASLNQNQSHQRASQQHLIIKEENSQDENGSFNNQSTYKHSMASTQPIDSQRLKQSLQITDNPINNQPIKSSQKEGIVKLKDQLSQIIIKTKKGGITPRKTYDDSKQMRISNSEVRLSLEQNKDNSKNISPLKIQLNKKKILSPLSSNKEFTKADKNQEEFKKADSSSKNKEDGNQSFRRRRYGLSPRSRQSNTPRNNQSLAAKDEITNINKQEIRESEPQTQQIQPQLLQQNYYTQQSQKSDNEQYIIVPINRSQKLEQDSQLKHLSKVVNELLKEQMQLKTQLHQQEIIISELSQKSEIQIGSSQSQTNKIVVNNDTKIKLKNKDFLFKQTNSNHLQSTKSPIPNIKLNMNNQVKANFQKYLQNSIKVKTEVNSASDMYRTPATQQQNAQTLSRSQPPSAPALQHINLKSRFKKNITVAQHEDQSDNPYYTAATNTKKSTSEKSTNEVPRIDLQQVNLEQKLAEEESGYNFSFSQRGGKHGAYDVISEEKKSNNKFNDAGWKPELKLNSNRSSSKGGLQSRVGTVESNQSSNSQLSFLNAVNHHSKIGINSKKFPKDFFSPKNSIQ